MKNIKHIAASPSDSYDLATLERTVDTVLDRGRELYRDFIWRRTSDPYEVLVSEVMLQQTQTVRVERYFPRWIERFPTIDSLAESATADVLEYWQGLGYNRRALALKQAAEIVSEQRSGVMPQTLDDLMLLPGIGPATAAGVLAFAYDESAVYLETNVRTVFLHELWPDLVGISDKVILAALQQAAMIVESRGVSARTWNYALLDYGVWLKKEFPNPSRRSKHHTVQSTFEGSRRQKRAALLKAVLADSGQDVASYAAECGLDQDVAADVLSDLVTEGFLVLESDGATYRVR